MRASVWTSVISDTHYAATWLLDPRAPKVEMPLELKERIALMKAEAHEGGTESFEVQVIFGIHRKQPDVFPHLFALIEELPPCHAGIVGIDCHIDQAGIYRSRQATAY